MLDFLMGPPDSKPRRPQGKKQEALSLWGHELLSRAVQAGPELEILRFITAGFMASALYGGAPYARRLTELTPDDLQAWMMLGILLGFERQVKEAQDVFRKTAQLARKQGDKEAARSADEMRRAVTDPAFTALVRMGLTAADDELDIFDF